jgi:lincosamide nucleotidyltransferase
MLPQTEMIARLRQACRADERLAAAMLYGSFPKQEADRFSDIDCLLFFHDEALPEIDPLAWVSQVAPVDLFYTNEFGIRVAIFSNLVRGEFHFDGVREMQNIGTWQGQVWFPSLEATLLLDRTGELADRLQPLIGPAPSHETSQDAQNLVDGFLNWTLFGSNLLARGELARALELLHLIHDYLLRMARLVEGKTGHWISPAKALEGEISPGAYRRFQACTAALDRPRLQHAYRASWEWGNELISILARRFELAVPGDLIEKLQSARFGNRAT